MKVIIRTLLISVLAMVLTVGLLAQELPKEEWQKQMNELTAKRDDLQAKLSEVEKAIEEADGMLAEKTEALENCNDELKALVGDYEASLNAIDSKLTSLSSLSNQGLMERKGELDEAAKMIAAAKMNPLAKVPKYANKLSDFDQRLEALRKALAGSAMMYTVGTWAKDRDCLWNIAKKPKIYDNAFLWPKIWQANRNQIKNPDIIHPGQKLTVPPKADLSSEEKSAVREYWRNKGQ
jgi:nucleoid-associated protein YgaU